MSKCKAWEGLSEQRFAIEPSVFHSLYQRRRISMAGADGRWWQDVDIMDSLNLLPLSRGMHLWVFFTVNALLFIQGGDW